MDTKNLYEKSLSKKVTEVNKGGINTGADQSQELLKNIMTVPKLRESNNKTLEKKSNKISEDVSKDAFLSGLLKKNEDLFQEGLSILGEEDEKDLSLDESLSGIDKEILAPLHDKTTRFKRYTDYPSLVQKDKIKVGNLLNNAGTVVKKGAFDDQMLETGRQFIQKINQHFGIDSNPTGTEKKFFREIGSKETVDFLYVDGKPIKKYVSDEYGYKGSGNKQQEKQILGAYAAMIAARQNHAITLVRPVIINGVAEVDIQNVGTYTGGNLSRSDKVKAIGYGLKGNEYVKYCESAFRIDMRAKAGRALRRATGKNVQGLDKLLQLKTNLEEAGRGSHEDYNAFLRAFNNYFKAVEFIGLNPDNMEVDAKDLKKLHKLSEKVTSTAIDYLKGKKMNLPRHLAVRDIRDLVSTHSGTMWGYLRDGIKDNGTISLKDILDKEQDGFAIYGMQQEIDNLKENKKAGDKNEYQRLEGTVKMETGQKSRMNVKTALLADVSVNDTYKKLVKAQNDNNVGDEVRTQYARQFLQMAATCMVHSETYGQQLRDRYAEDAGSEDKLIFRTAQDQVFKAFSSEFKNIPALKSALDFMKEQYNSQVAMEMTYATNTVGNNITFEEFKKYGGSAEHTYVTEKEAAEIVATSSGFLCTKKVQGKDGIVELRPSLPEFAVLDKGNPIEKPVPLRKTMKTVFKAIAYFAMDENGQMKLDVGKKEEENLIYWLDRLFTLEQKRSDKEKFELTCDEVLFDAVKTMLTAEYRRKGRRHAEHYAHNDAVDIVEDFKKIYLGNEDNMVSSPDVGVLGLAVGADVMKKINVDEFFNDPKVQSIKVAGQPITKAEYEEIINEMKKEVTQAEAEFKQIRDMDLDDEEMPCFSSCFDNVHYQKDLYYSHVGRQPRQSFLYKLNALAKADPNGLLDAMLSHLDYMLDSSGKEQEVKDADRQKLMQLDQQRKKNGSLTPKEIESLKETYREYSKYDAHKGANLGTTGKTTYTIETYACTPDKLYQSPYTFKARIGRYNSNKAQQKLDGDTNEIMHDGMEAFYNKDNGLVHCESRKNALRCLVKEAIRTKYVVKEINKQI
ncbi:hypothetical protein [Butyrivibrio sp. AE3009]|uniref:hypothetical protein n=1 Tax=Butyrivibrio sp. AE3009 TaxID=1280666 RepID=UPI0003B75254|nr:hypothetical protein [Butyrivibrio sp. AE3009]